jgi:transposase
MLAELVDHVIGVDPDRDWITVAALDSRTAGVITTDRFPATRDGYHDAIAWADAHTEESERAWVIEGTASYGRGLTMALQRLDELVIEFDRPMRKATKDGAKSDALDAIRAAREALGRDKLNQPRANDGIREAIRVHTVARAAAVRARTAAVKMNRPGFSGDSDYWFPTSCRSVCWAA